MANKYYEQFFPKLGSLKPEIKIDNEIKKVGNDIANLLFMPEVSAYVKMQYRYYFNKGLRKVSSMDRVLSKKVSSAFRRV